MDASEFGTGARDRGRPGPRRWAAAVLALAVLAGAGVACSDIETSVDDLGNLAVQVEVPSASGSGAAVRSSGVTVRPSVTVEGNDSTMTIERAAIVFRELQLAPVGAECQFSGEAVDGDGCATPRIDADVPVVDSVPVSTGRDPLAPQVPAEPDDYDGLAFLISPLDPFDLQDSEVLSDGNQEMENASMRVEGTVEGESFARNIALDEEIRLSFPILTLDGGESATVTLIVEIGEWFLDAEGNLLDPRGGLTDSERSTLQDNIRASLSATTGGS